MNVCKECGTEFYGKFCPECGARWSGENACPKCGQKVASYVMTCPQCGCDIPKPEKSVSDEDHLIPPDEVSPEAEAATGVVGEKESSEIERSAALVRSALLYIVHPAVRILPTALAVLFAVIVPLLYIAPVASLADELAVGGEEIGNVYSMPEDFFGTCVALMVFFAVAAVYSVIAVVLWRRRKYSKIAKLPSLGVYTAFIILAAVLMGEASSLNEFVGGGAVDAVFAGGAPKSILAVSIVFFVLTAAALVTWQILENKFPQLVPDEATNKKEEVRKFDRPVKKPLLYFAYVNVKLGWAVAVYYLCTLFTSGALFFLVFFSNYTNLYLAIIISASVTVVLVALCAKVDPSGWTPEGFLPSVAKNKNHDECKLGIKKIVFTGILLVIMAIYVIANSTTWGGMRVRGYIMAIVYLAASILIYVLAKITVAVQNGAIAKVLFGCEGPLPNAPLTYDYDAKFELAAYEEYIRAKKQGNVADGEYTRKKVKMRRTLLSLACALFVVAATVCASVSPLLTDKFSASYISLLIDDGIYVDYGALVDLLGEPYEKADLSDEERIISYFDADYIELNDKINKATKEGDYGKVSAYRERAANMKFDSLTLRLKRTGNTYKYVDITLNTCAAVVGKNVQKKAKSAELFNAKCKVGVGFSNESCYAEIYYTDGSYKYTQLMCSELSGIDIQKLGKQTVSWADEWGSYSATVKVE